MGASEWGLAKSRALAALALFLVAATTVAIYSTSELRASSCAGKDGHERISSGVMSGPLLGQDWLRCR